MPGRPRKQEWLLSAPSLIWLLLLFLIPTLLVFAIAFRPADAFGGIGTGWTLETFRRLMNPSYPQIIWRTLWMSVVTTAVCLGVAVPVGYYIARTKPAMRSTLLMLVIIPFWTNFLVRIFAWKVVLHPEGLLKKLLVFLHIIPPDVSLLYNEGAVLLVLIYTYLPFAILPIYAAAEKFDFQLLEAAMDLGSSRLRAFCNTFLPGIGRGLLTATLVVFVPALGSYVIPDIMGGPSGEMIGNKIAQRVFIDRNLPHASGLAALLSLVVLIPLVWILIQKGREHVDIPEDRP